MQNRKIVITDGPGTGKSSIVKHLEQHGYPCLHEVSREITATAQKEGISQLFLEKPILFSEKLLEARKNQYQQALLAQEPVIFFDRGLPDIVAYMDYFNTDYPEKFTVACKESRYDDIFLLPPWKEIYQTDNERYETFEQAKLIHNFLKKAYITYGYSPIEVPFGAIENRSNFILNKLHA
ncbi:ATP-binding protein [Antarcticibacterium sp. 1MA-6-2]|uniref:AAA family ATPase n=1 Tax=Antarcticibacterium sp. 1MA-6-2 TaxID=2908210 RepID=UPI001F294911|nr:ATP-binding protein [Antarcticibacterium sp. 1MA-6-2]UJH91842.1 ATP-binding protein [Antarcticibacterium sp. 1MA-6-2]